MQITSTPNKRPGERDEQIHLKQTASGCPFFRDGVSPTVFIPASGDRDYCAELAPYEVLRCFFTLPPEEIAKAVAELASPKMVAMIPDVVKALTAGAMAASNVS